ncbi:NADH-ubiquinone oxidoreductase chain H, partial [uncultured Rubrobacteraceae bacterium]
DGPAHGPGLEGAGSDHPDLAVRYGRGYACFL